VDFQKQHYGMIFQNRETEQIESDNIILLGKAELNKLINNRKFGFNLVLKKDSEQDLYGEWWICKFTDAPFFSNVVSGLYYAFDPNTFFTEYEFGRKRVTHSRNMEFMRLDDNEIIDLIEKMPG